MTWRSFAMGSRDFPVNLTAPVPFFASTDVDSVRTCADNASDLRGLVHSSPLTKLPHLAVVALRHAQPLVCLALALSLIGVACPSGAYWPKMDR
ncbi:hypothetical protein EI94DRAFT_1806696 [Lactarius quietus]|nr:hypothetical protein EI94DRAFT_1806696 [Lactarius quietus]